MKKIKYIVLIFPFILAYFFVNFYEAFMNLSSYYYFDRYLIFLIVLEFIFLHLVIKPKKIWDFIYRFRFLLGFLLFSFIILMGYHGTSVGIYNEMIEPSNHLKEAEPIYGINRAIRSDEWVVNSPVILSQYSDLNNFSNVNHTLNGYDINITLYPKLPSKSVTILSSPKLLGFLFLPVDQAFSFYWYFELFVLFFASFEFLLIITKKSKFWSLVGALMITFGPAVQWWESNCIVPILYSGLLAIVFFEKFIFSKKWFYRFLYSLLIGLCGTIFVNVLYPAWMIPFAYFYIIVIIWILYKNKNLIKVKYILFLLAVVIITMSGILLPEFISSYDNVVLTTNTIYPGKRFSVGGFGFEVLFGYVLGLIFPYVDFPNPCEASQFLSFYPIPIIIAITIIIDNFKKKKNDIFLIMLTLVTLFLNMWNYFELPTIVAKISFLYLSTSLRTTVVVSFLCVILLVYILSNYERYKFGSKVFITLISLFVSFISVVFIKNYYQSMLDFSSYIFILVLIFTILISFILSNFRFKKIILGLSLILVTLISGLTVNPVNKGLSSIYDKQLSHDIENILKEDSDSLWITTDSPIYYSNYILANGAKVLNSVNYFPNYNLWNIIDIDRKYENEWNRYAHVNVNLSTEETNVILNQSDLITILLNKYDLCKLKVDYLVSTDLKLDRFNSKDFRLDVISNNDSYNIYSLSCN